MRTALLTGVNLAAKRFTYTLSEPFFYYSVVYGMSHDSPFFEVFSRQDFTKVWSDRRTELTKTLGVKSHAEVIRDLGYARGTSLDWVEGLSDEELLTCIEEFTKTGDDLEPFLEELDRR